MQKVKLIIEIDENTYKDIKKGKVYSSVRDVPQESVLAIAHGIPLDDVKAEIKTALAKEGNTDTSKAQAIALNWVLELLDNVDKTESEEKE